jgi:hypothetical protein
MQDLKNLICIHIAKSHIPLLLAVPPRTCREAGRKRKIKGEMNIGMEGIIREKA